jgi:hypothetical protein
MNRQYFDGVEKMRLLIKHNNQLIKFINWLLLQDKLQFKPIQMEFTAYEIIYDH